MAAFEYDGIRVKWTPKERKVLDEIRRRNADAEFNNGNGSNKEQTSGTLPYMRIGKDLYSVRDKWGHDLLEGITDV